MLKRVVKTNMVGYFGLAIFDEYDDLDVFFPCGTNDLGSTIEVSVDFFSYIAHLQNCGHNVKFEMP